jgi:hypothetical protein
MNNLYLFNTTTGGKCKSIYLLALTDLDGRIIGVMMSFMMVFYTGMETAQSVVNGPIVKVMSAL